MRHRKYSRSFGRGHHSKKALFRGLVHSLVRYGRIRTTLPKAKELRKFIEPAITLAKRGDFNAKRLLLSRFPHRPLVQALCGSIAPRFKDRPGGYTRIIRLGDRAGDRAQMAFIEFSDYDYTKAATFFVTSNEEASSKQLSHSLKARKKKLQKIQKASRRISFS